MIMMFIASAIALELSAQSQSGPATEGIVVRGSWTIDVKNRDGQVVTHRQFENALTAEGQWVLGKMLRGHLEGTPFWGIEIAPPAPAPLSSPCTRCITFQPHPSFPGGFPQNVVTTETQDGMVLTGSFRAEADGSIGLVATRILPCNSSDCYYNKRFSEKTIAPIPVVAAQTIDLKVVFSFRSPTAGS
jgi:hypothetical protein